MTQDLTVQQGGEVATVAPESVLAAIAQIAKSPDVDVAKMQMLLDMQERLMNRQAEIAFNASMQAAQSEMKQILRDAKAEGKPYARLETIDLKTREIVTRNGFALTFGSKEAKKEGAVCVTCHVMHRAGHSRDYELEGDLDTTGIKGSQNKTNIQGLGSAVSYLRRYLKLMIFDLILTNEDNDGNRIQPTESFVNEDQVRTIIDLMQDAGLKENDSAFLAWAGVDRVERIQKQAYQRVVAMLNKKIQGMVR